MGLVYPDDGMIETPFSLRAAGGEFLRGFFEFIEVKLGFRGGALGLLRGKMMICSLAHRDCNSRHKQARDSSLKLVVTFGSSDGGGGGGAQVKVIPPNFFITDLRRRRRIRPWRRTTRSEMHLNSSA